MTRRLEGLTCFISGASSGIGAALARELAARGARLALNARRVEKLEALAGELPGKHAVLPGDVGDHEACRDLVKSAAEALGRIDVLVCNAGYGATKLSWKQTPEDVRRMFAVNVHGTHDLIHHAVPQMLWQEPRDGLKGQLMLVSSAAARRGIPFMGPYAATKAAQLSLAEALRVELHDDAIAVTSVHPAGTTTEFGDVAEREGDVRVEDFAGRGAGSQSAEHVARTMVRAIERPRAEVWPNRPYRWLLALNAIAPTAGDRGMLKMRRKVKDD